MTRFDTGESTAAIVARSDDARWPLILPMLRAGATLVRLPRLSSYCTDDGQHVGKYSLSATRVRNLERAGILSHVGIDRYALSDQAKGAHE